MGTIHHQYSLLQKYMRGDRSMYPASSCVQLVMECAVVANAATETVNRAENELAIDHPHISSFYHALALVFLTGYVADINKRIEKPKLEMDPYMALPFVAEIVESSFHDRFGVKRIPGITNRFVEKSGLEGPAVRNIGQWTRAIRRKDCEIYSLECHGSDFFIV